MSISQREIQRLLTGKQDEFLEENATCCVPDWEHHIMLGIGCRYRSRA
jgi:hypothetical protein